MNQGVSIMQQQTYPDHHPIRTGTINAGQPAVPFAALMAPLTYIGEVLAELIFSTLRFAEKLISAWRCRRNIRRNTVTLSNLDDHILRDIGIGRDQIDHLALMAAAQPRQRHYYDYELLR
jgi:uncharacterized protein YjiS (DUF1127 family)